jgi:hypothetical protein
MSKQQGMSPEVRERNCTANGKKAKGPWVVYRKYNGNWPFMRTFRGSSWQKFNSYRTEKVAKDVIESMQLKIYDRDHEYKIVKED